jgi:hypothetical protein
MMVSFHVTALFPNVPIEDAISLLKKWLKQNITDVHPRHLCPIQWPILPTNIWYKYGKRFVTVVG